MSGVVHIKQNRHLRFARQIATKKRARGRLFLICPFVVVFGWAINCIYDGFMNNNNNNNKTIYTQMIIDDDDDKLLFGG